MLPAAQASLSEGMLSEVWGLICKRGQLQGVGFLAQTLVSTVVYSLEAQFSTYVG